MVYHGIAKWLECIISLVKFQHSIQTLSCSIKKLKDWAELQKNFEKYYMYKRTSLTFRKRIYRNFKTRKSVSFLFGPMKVINAKLSKGRFSLAIKRQRWLTLATADGFSNIQTPCTKTWKIVFALYWRRKAFS